MPYLTRLSGALLVLVGAYVGCYGWYEPRVYAGGSAEDTVVSAAAQIQSRLAQWVDGVGRAAFATALVISVEAVIGARAVTAPRAARVFAGVQGGPVRLSALLSDGRFGAQAQGNH